MADDGFYGETEGQKLLRKSRENPAFPLALTGLAGVVLYGAYKYRHRGTMSTSIFLIQLRVAAQGTAIGCLTVGMAVTMAQKLWTTLQEKKD